MVLKRSLGMKKLFLSFLLIALPSLVCIGSVPAKDDVLREMAIPSTETVRGQKDGVGYAKNAEQMNVIWDLSETGPSPLCFGEETMKGALTVIAPHDDYVYAGRLYKSIIPSIKAKTVVIVGPFHRWKDFDVKGKIIFDGYKAWRTPDGDVPVSKMRENIISGLPANEYVRDNTMHDAEHSIEGPLYWLKHSNPSVEIIPILVTPMDYQTMQQTINDLETTLANYLEFTGQTVGNDIAFLISADAVHYGEDFKYTPYGAGGTEAYIKAVEDDKVIVSKLLSGTVNERRLKAIFERFQDVNVPESYKITWCGRFSIPFGLSVASQLFNELKGRGNKGLVFYGRPIAYSTSIGAPSLPSRTGMSTTAPSNLYHFVGYPAVIYGQAMVEPLKQNKEPLQ
jgi:MEMO1 family protein